MGPAFQFVIAAAIAVTTMVTGSLAWPRLTYYTRPKLLQQVHDMVIKTPVGQRTADVLGVSDETNIEPIRPGDVVTAASNGIKNAVTNRIQTVIVGNAVNELTRRYDQLPESQKAYIQEAICRPAPAVDPAP